MSLLRTAALIALLAPSAAAHGQAAPWKIEMRQVRLPTPNGDCGPIEVNARDAEGKTPMTPDGKQIDWQDFDITLTQGAGPLKLTGNGRFLCATAPGATGVVTATYPESTYLTGNGRGRTGKRLIPGVTVSATLNVRSAGTAAGVPPTITTELPDYQVTGTMTPEQPSTNTTTTGSSAPTSVPIDGITTKTTSGQMSSLTQTLAQSLSCSVPVESITSVPDLVLTSTSGGVSLSWQKIPCPSMTYRRVTVAVKDGQTTQTASAVQPSVDAATGQLYTTDAPASAGLASANYRIDATLPDGRIVSSRWVTWTSPPRIQLAGFSGSGLFGPSPPPPRIELPGFAGSGLYKPLPPPPRVDLPGFTGTGAFPPPPPPPRVFLDGFTGSGLYPPP